MVKTTHRTLVDDRGYIFVLPSLGLPDPSGEWLSIKAAIGTKQRATPVLNSDTPAPHREAASDDSTIEVEYEKAVWTLPILSPETVLKDPEMFMVRVRRVRAATAPANTERISLADGMRMFCLQPEPQEFGIDLFTGREGEQTPGTGGSVKKKMVGGKYDYIQSRKNEATEADAEPRAGLYASFKNGFDPTKATKVNQETDEDSSDDGDSDREWKLGDEDAFRSSWFEQLYLDLFVEALRKGETIERKMPGMKLRIHPAEDHDYRSMDYIVRQDGDERLATGEDEWKEIPEHAVRRGVLSCWVNFMRVYKGRKPFSMEEWKEMMAKKAEEK